MRRIMYQGNKQRALLLLTTLLPLLLVLPWTGPVFVWRWGVGGGLLLLAFVLLATTLRYARLLELPAKREVPS